MAYRRNSWVPNDCILVGINETEKYQKPHVLVAMRFIIYTRTYSGSYAISCQEYKLDVWCQNCNTLLNIQYNKCSQYNSSSMWNPCWSINGHKSNTSTSTLKAACATPYKGSKWSIMGREPLEWTWMPIGWGHWACLLDTLHIHP